MSWYTVFPRLLTHYNWFIWPSFHTVLKTKTLFSKCLTHFSCLYTRSNLLCVFWRHTGQDLRMIHRSTSDYVFWEINSGSGRQRGIGGVKKKGRGWGQRSVVPDEIQSIMVDHVLLHGLTMREVGLQAHLQGFSTTYTYNIITVPHMRELSLFYVQ